eukprot:2166677-Rhodomonas_salina.1
MSPLRLRLRLLVAALLLYSRNLNRCDARPSEALAGRLGRAGLDAARAQPRRPPPPRHLAEPLAPRAQARPPLPPPRPPSTLARLQCHHTGVVSTKQPVQLSGFGSDMHALVGLRL